MAQEKKKTKHFDIFVFIIVFVFIALVMFIGSFVITHTVQYNIKSYTDVFTEEDDDAEEFIIGKSTFACVDSYEIWIDEGHGYRARGFDADQVVLNFDVESTADAYVKFKESVWGTVPGRVEFHIPKNSKFVTVED